MGNFGNVQIPWMLNFNDLQKKTKEETYLSKQLDKAYIPAQKSAIVCGTAGAGAGATGILAGGAVAGALSGALAGTVAVGSLIVGNELGKAVGIDKLGEKVGTWLAEKYPNAF